MKTLDGILSQASDLAGTVKSALPSGHDLRTFGEYLGLASIEGVICLHILPTGFRWASENSSQGQVPIYSDPPARLGLYSGSVVGSLVTAAAYSQLLEHGHPEALLVPVITNAASALYESGRFLYRHIRNARHTKDLPTDRPAAPF